MSWIACLFGSIALVFVFMLGGFVVSFAGRPHGSFATLALSRLLLLGLFCLVFACLVSAFVKFGLEAIGVSVL